MNIRPYFVSFLPFVNSSIFCYSFLIRYSYSFSRLTCSTAFSIILLKHKDFFLSFYFTAKFFLGRKTSKVLCLEKSVIFTQY